MNPVDDDQLATCASDDPPPSAVAEQHETTSQVMQLIEELPANQREVLQLKFQAGLSYKEISQVTDLSVSNVGFLLHIALKTIRQRLKAESDVAPKP